MKYLVETTGSFQLMCLGTGQMISAFRPSVITNSGFFQQRLASGQITVLKELPDNADDALWAHHLSNPVYKDKLDVAIKDYLDGLDPPPPAAKVVEKTVDKK